MCSNCSNLGDVMHTHYETELNADTPLLFNDSGTYSVRLDNWPTDISAAPTMEHLNSLIGG
jgi:hypothetical protein